MQIMIEIDEETFNKLPEAEFGSNVIEDVLEAVENGTILPKGHGRLKDVDALEVSTGSIDDWSVEDFVYLDEIEDAPTIIGADSIESENRE